jgi:hypothetical protein
MTLTCRGSDCELDAGAAPLPLLQVAAFSHRLWWSTAAMSEAQRHQLAVPGNLMPFDTMCSAKATVGHRKKANLRFKHAIYNLHQSWQQQAHCYIRNIQYPSTPKSSSPAQPHTSCASAMLRHENRSSLSQGTAANPPVALCGNSLGKATMESRLPLSTCLCAVQQVCCRRAYGAFCIGLLLPSLNPGS